MKIHFDFESRSPIDIRKCGAYVYAEHRDTQVLCLSVKIDNDPSVIWVPEEFRVPAEVEISDAGLRKVAEHAATISAHNAGFERAMWSEHMVKRRGFPEIPIQKWDDTAARAAMCALPRSLDQACKALGVAQQKDQDGYKLMLRMCKPRALRKAEREELAESLGWLPERVADAGKRILELLKTDPTAPDTLPENYHQFVRYHFSPDEFMRLCRYCLQDTEAEAALDKALPPLFGMERRIWELDQVINDRGILADLDAVAKAEALVYAHESRLQAELHQLTKGRVSSAQAVAQFGEWLTNQGAEMGNLQKQTVKDALGTELDPDVRQALEIRQSLSMSSTAKLSALRSCTCIDGRMRGSVMYHGAGTGRWTGKGFQPQNLPRGNEDIAKHQDEILDSWLTAGPKWVSLAWGDPMDVVSTCLRGMLIPRPGHDLIAADYSAIEGRGLAWLAGEEHVLDGYRQGLDPYKVAAQGIYKLPYDQIDKPKRQVGKTAELACGYQGGWKAMLAFGADRLGMTEQEMKDAVAGWREARPKTVALWRGLEDSAFTCVQTRAETQFRSIKFRIKGPFLQMILPSGRPLWYFAPSIIPVQTPWGEEKLAVTAMTVNSMTKQWERRPYHGGLWAENATQAMCRDILALGLIRCEDAGYFPVLHVHDEIVAEVPEGFGSVEEMERIMSVVPKWAAGMPIRAEGFRAKRYRK